MRRALLVVVLVLTLPACTSVGAGLPTVRASQVEGARAGLTGVVHVEQNGCFTVDTADGVHRWVVWPSSGARQDDDEVVLGGPLSTTRVGEGASVECTGLVAGADVLPDWANPDSLLGANGRYCHADETGIAVFDVIRAAS